MGFEILSVEDGDIDEMHPKYDVFELTSAQKWVPARFRTSPAVHEKIMLRSNHLTIHL